MDQIGWIRRLKGREGKSEREIARMTGLSRNTVAKWLRTDVQRPALRRPNAGTQPILQSTSSVMYRFG